MALLTHVWNSPFPLFNGGCGRQKVTKRGWICNFHEESGEGGRSAKKKVSLIFFNVFSTKLSGQRLCGLWPPLYLIFPYIIFLLLSLNDYQTKPSDTFSFTCYFYVKNIVTYHDLSNVTSWLPSSNYYQLKSSKHWLLWARKCNKSGSQNLFRLYIFQWPHQRRIENAVKHLRWSVLQK